MSTITRPDWTVARIGASWSETDLDTLNKYGDCPPLARAIEKAMVLRRTRYLLVNVPLFDLVWNGGEEKPPSPRHKINWRSMFLVDLGQDRTQPRHTPLWVHPDIASLKIAPIILEAFVPTSDDVIQLVSARQFFIMADEVFAPAKLVTESASNEGQRRLH